MMQDNDLRALKDSWGTAAIKLARTFLESRIGDYREAMEKEDDPHEIYRLQGRIAGLKEALEDMAPDEFEAQRNGGYTA